MKIWQEILYVILLSVGSLVTLFVMSRLGGKRQIAQMNMFDYVNSITIGSIAAEMATNLEEWYKPFVAILVYGFLAWLVHYVSYKTLAGRKLFSGAAVVLMENGHIYNKELERAAISLNEFLGQCHVAGYFDLSELNSVVMETSGQLSFLPKSANRPVTPDDMDLKPDPASTWMDLVIDGKLMPENLNRAGKTTDWLRQQLGRQGIGQISEAFYAACDKQNNFFACRIDPK